MIIPNAENAVVDIRKLLDYVLNPQHERGKHKEAVKILGNGVTLENVHGRKGDVLEIVAFPLLREGWKKP